jgi:dihydrofolate synthase/folylpolyglutamate synthase
MLSASAPLSDWLTWLETLSAKEIDLGLERVQAVLGRLSLAPPEHVLLIGGTNGKGSSVAMTAALLGAAGYSYGAYTSPHVIDYNERIVVNGAAADDETITTALARVEAARDGLPLTYFEFGTLAAAVVFAEAGLDAWILEVGMGGRLDATNAIDPTASLITNVSLDHCDWLGVDVEAIAFEKAGIMRKGIPTVFASTDVPRAITRHARDCGARLLLADRDFHYTRGEAGSWDWSGADRRIERLPAPGLRGDFQYGNAAAVLALLEAAGLERALDPERIAEALPRLTLAGRLQAINAGETNWLLDVAHNPAAAQVLAAALDDLYGPKRERRAIWAVIGLLDDKDVDGIVTALDTCIDHWIATTASSPRALPAIELGRRVANACGRPCRVVDQLDDAIDEARRLSTDADSVLVTGSFYVVGPALERLQLYSPRTP